MTAQTIAPNEILTTVITLEPVCQCQQGLALATGREIDAELPARCA